MQFVRTNDIVTEAELRALLCLDGEDPYMADIVETHDGDWRREAGPNGRVWRFWEIEDL